MHKSLLVGMRKIKRVAFVSAPPAIASVRLAHAQSLFYLRR
jgi:hypothetical protein